MNYKIDLLELTIVSTFKQVFSMTSDLGVMRDGRDVD